MRALEWLDIAVHAAMRENVGLVAMRGPKETLDIAVGTWIREHAPTFDHVLNRDLDTIRIQGRGVDLSDLAADLIRALGWSREIPHEYLERLCLYRELASARKILLRLDNADQPAQVRAFHAGAPGSLVIATCRRKLSGLAMDNAVFIVVHDDAQHPHHGDPTR